jgi:hypothetical protein
MARQKLGDFLFYDVPFLPVAHSCVYSSYLNGEV